MSTDTISYLLTLPNEILFKIFDNVDIISLFFSIGHTCHRLRQAVQNYDNLSVDLTLLDKSQFQCLLNLINPHHVTSLTLTQQEETSGAISIFSTHFRRRKFERLKSLSVNHVRYDQLPSVLKCFECSNLISFTLRMDDFIYSRSNTTTDAIGFMIARPHLRQVTLQMEGYHIGPIKWPTNNIIEKLTLIRSLTIKELCIILDHLPRLKILSTNSIHRNYSESQMKVEGSTEKFRQLTSLTIEQFDGTIDDIEYLLSLTSSLTHFKLIGKGDYRDGKRWEQFIQSNLPQLEKFEFFFEINLVNSMSAADIQLIVASFQTPFWFEHKKWIVHQEVVRVQQYSCRLRLYSLPICINKYICHINEETNSISCADINDPSHMDNVIDLEWNIEKSVKTTDRVKLIYSNQVIFRHVKTLTLYLNDQALTDWVGKLSSFVDLKTVSEVKINGLSDIGPQKLNMAAVSQCLLLMPSLQSFQKGLDPPYRNTLPASIYCEIVPPSVKHLSVEMKTLDDCITVLEQFDRLWTFKCFVADHPSSSQIQNFENWLDENRNGSSFTNAFRLYCVWLTRVRMVSRHKRRKYN